MPDFERENTFWITDPRTQVCGVDEVGRGPCAGPVVAAAVILDRDLIQNDVLTKINDSKKLNGAVRDHLFEILTRHCDHGIGMASVGEIDTLNIRQASLLAMTRAVEALSVPPHHALIDGRDIPHGLTCAATPVIGGDGKSLSIAAASIVAKVTRDRLMGDLADIHPGYGWERNAGYGTKEHLIALDIQGVTVHHRRSFAPVKKRLSKNLTASA